MKMRKMFLVTLTLWGSTLTAQDKKETEAIKSFCGCYEVTFKYAETFSPDTAYKNKPVYKANGLEWVMAEESSDKKIVLQHLLLIDDSTVIKHWREDWEYEKTEWLQFKHDASWQKKTADKTSVAGQWTQTVWEVDDAPRYQGTAKWVNNGNKYFWENTTDAPLPRREYTKRNDYNVMERTNKLIITDTGWVHEQDNKKIMRKDNDQLIAEEKGYNIYRKIEDSKCAVAKDFWEKEKAFWKAVRNEWEILLKNKNNVQLIARVNGRLLYQELDELQNHKLQGEELQRKLKEIIQRHLAS